LAEVAHKAATTTIAQLQHDASAEVGKELCPRCCCMMTLQREERMCSLMQGIATTFCNSMHGFLYRCKPKTDAKESFVGFTGQVYTTTHCMGRLLENGCNLLVQTNKRK